MKKQAPKNLDIYLGLTAWALVLLALAARHFIPLGYQPLVMQLLVPLGWSLCVVLMAVISNRPARKLWWAWLSGPLAFIDWVFLVFLLAAWGK